MWEGGTKNQTGLVEDTRLLVQRSIADSTWALSKKNSNKISLSQSSATWTPAGRTAELNPKDKHMDIVNTGR